jgi:hypothetical protein
MCKYANIHTSTHTHSHLEEKWCVHYRTVGHRSHTYAFTHMHSHRTKGVLQCMLMHKYTHYMHTHVHMYTHTHAHTHIHTLRTKGASSAEPSVAFITSAYARTGAGVSARGSEELHSTVAVHSSARSTDNRPQRCIFDAACV